MKAGSTRAAAAAAALWMFAGLSGCHTGGTVGPDENLRPIPWQADEAYREAKLMWVEIHSIHMDQGNLDRERRQVIALLEDAKENSPKCALFYTKIGELYLAEAAPPHRLAYQQFEQAYRLCYDFVPAWLGFAQIAIERGEFEKAHAFLDGAEWAMESLQSWGRPEPPGTLDAFLQGVGLQAPESPEQRAFWDPRLDPATAKSYVLQWIHESLEWTFDNRALTLDLLAAHVTGAPTGASSVSEQDLMRRLQARIELLRVFADNPGDPHTLLAGIERALEFDPNYFDARFKKGQVLFYLGEYDRARAVLERYHRVRRVDFPMLWHYDELHDLLAKIYTHLYLAHRGAGELQRVAEYYVWLKKYQGGYPDGSLWRIAQDYFIARGAEDRAAVLRAQEALAKWTGPEAERAVARQLGEDMATALQSMTDGGTGQR